MSKNSYVNLESIRKCLDCDFRVEDVIEIGEIRCNKIGKSITNQKNRNAGILKSS